MRYPRLLCGPGAKAASPRPTCTDPGAVNDGFQARESLLAASCFVTLRAPILTLIQSANVGLMKSGRGLRTLRPTHKTLIRMYKVLYLGLDAHARLCVLALMNASGRVIGTEAFSTSEAALVQAVSDAPARIKYLAVEESALAGWIANALRPHVDERIVCDPRHNALISRSGHKDDYADAIKLCRLHRMGELKSVYPTDDSDRVDFKIAVQQYLALRRDPARLKTQIKANYPHVVNVAGTQVFGQTERERYLKQVPSKARRQSIGRLYAMLDATGRVRKEARAAMVELGRRYPEIKQFRRVPGIGVVGAHVFSAFIQTPHRFATRQKLWRYCRLGIYQRSSAGKPVIRTRLDRSGSGALKAVSYQCWLSATHTAEPNEVSRFYEASLRRTGNDIRARLNTQRKVLTVLWTICDVDYDPNLFHSPAPVAIAHAAATP